MKQKTFNVIFITLAILFMGTVYYIDEYAACNPKGSLGAKINWAGHGECK